MPPSEIGCLDAADAILDMLPNPGDLMRRSADLRQRASTDSRTLTAFGEGLSDREIAVLRLASQGLTQREIANQLFISYNTVKSHLRTTYREAAGRPLEERRRGPLRSPPTRR